MKIKTWPFRNIWADIFNIEIGQGQNSGSGQGYWLWQYMCASVSQYNIYLTFILLSHVLFSRTHSFTENYTFFICVYKFTFITCICVWNTCRDTLLTLCACTRIPSLTAVWINANLSLHKINANHCLNN